METQKPLASLLSTTIMPRKRVSFGTVSVREYERIVGDHPETRVGPPLAIGNNFVQNDNVLVKDFEKQRKIGHFRRFSSKARTQLLGHEWGISTRELHRAEAEVQRIRRQRSRTGDSNIVSSLLFVLGGGKLEHSFSRENLLGNYSAATVIGKRQNSFASTAA